MPAEEVLLPAEHVHGTALAFGIAAAASGQFGHHAFGIHPGGKHMPVVAVSCYDLFPLFEGHLHADHARFLADVEMAEPAYGAHSIELSGLFLETPDQKHVAKRAKL